MQLILQKVLSAMYSLKNSVLFTTQYSEVFHNLHMTTTCSKMEDIQLVLCICTKRTHNFHPALITMMMYNVLVFKHKTVLQHYHHERVCCAWIIHVLVYVRLDPYCMMGYGVYMFSTNLFGSKYISIHVLN